MQHDLLSRDIIVVMLVGVESNEDCFLSLGAFHKGILLFGLVGAIIGDVVLAL